MISVSVQTRRLVRLAGRLAPPGDHLAELRTAEGPVLVRADEQGRFVMDEVIRGPAQLVLRAAVDVPGEARDIGGDALHSPVSIGERW